ncbi:uncharacterized protein LOC123307104 [Coccinella septempunctata]|uniref:uncharacterized protein LOC123307104 n=1 Tax=Coccinella septempunctata TaxID=41139 RepID=UPI001D072097|nr:uncharacterized protein LOC123307104 [Coccinella septempunctata]
MVSGFGNSVSAVSAMFALCMSRGPPTIQDVHNQNCLNKQVKGGYLLRYRKGLFCSGWTEEWVVLFEDSTLAWYADKGLSRPRGRIRIGDSPDLLAVGEWTRKVPKRPRFPRNCHIGQLIAIGSRRPQDVHWLIAQSPTEVTDWMTAIGHTLPPPPHFPVEDKVQPHKQLPQSQQHHRENIVHLQVSRSLPKSSSLYQKAPSTSLATASRPQNFENDHTVISGVELGWGHGWGWGGAVWAAEATCVHEAAVSSSLYCQNLEDYSLGGYEEMDWSAIGDFCF